MDVRVSPVCSKDGKQFAYVSFENGEKYAEGKIPDCCITKNEGFSEMEVEQLTAYMHQNLTQLKKAASSINVLDVMMKE